MVPSTFGCLDSLWHLSRQLVCRRTTGLNCDTLLRLRGVSVWTAWLMIESNPLARRAGVWRRPWMATAAAGLALAALPDVLSDCGVDPWPQQPPPSAPISTVNAYR